MNRFFKPVVLLLTVLLVAYVAWRLGYAPGHFHALNARSAALQKDLTEQLSNGKPVALFALTDKASPHAAAVCIISPYARWDRILPPNANLGFDASWVGSSDDGIFAIVTLTESGEVGETFSLDRGKLDIRPYGWGSRCFRRFEFPRFVPSGFEEGARRLMKLESESGALN